MPGLNHYSQSQITQNYENQTAFRIRRKQNEVTQILGSNGVNMTAFSLADSGEFGILRMIVSDVGRAVSALKEARFGISVTEVVCFCCPNEPGALSIVLDCLAREDVFIEYMYAFSDGDTARVVIRPTDLDRCIEILTRCKCNLLNRDNLSQK